MKKKRISSIILLLLCIMALVLLFIYERVIPGFGAFANKNALSKDYEIVSSFNKSIAIVSVGNIEVEISPDLLADGYYLFLPSMATSFYIANLADECVVTVEGQTLANNHNRISLNNYHEISEEGYHELIVELNSGERLHVMQSSNLPAMFITAEVDQGTLDSVKGVEYGGECFFVDSTGKIIVSDSLEYMSPRGNTTFLLDKKPYDLKFSTEKQLLNDYTSRRWVLLANAMDKTLLKNATIYDFINNNTKALTAKGEYIDLYINGDYRGNYYLCNRPQYIDSMLASLNLTGYKYLSVIGEGNDELEYISNAEGTAFGKLNQSSDVSGKECLYLVEFTLQDVSDQISGFYTESGVWGRVVLPKNASLAQVEYIKNEFDALEAIIGDEASIASDNLSEIEQYMDIDSYTDRYLVDNIFQNHDSGLASSWFYKKPDSVDTKIYTGPLWDYDSTMHYQYAIDEWDTTINGNVYLSEQLLRYNSFIEVLSEKYDTTYRPYVKYEMPSRLYEISRHISRSRYLNNLRWGFDILSDESVMDELLATTIERTEVIEERILQEDSYCTVTFLDYDKKFKYLRVVKKGESLDTIPIDTSYLGLFSGWTNSVDGSVVTSETRIWENIVCESEWISMDILIQNGMDMADISAEYLDYDMLTKVLEEIIKMRDSVDFGVEE